MNSVDEQGVRALPPSEEQAGHEPSPSVSAVPVTIPSADLLTMSPGQKLVLDRMDCDLGYPFRDIASDCGLTIPEVRSIVRQFHTLGMTGYGPLYDEDGGGVRGKGYWLSRHGVDLQRQMRTQLGTDLCAMREIGEAWMMEKREALCPHFEAHTVCPEGYIHWHAWAEGMTKTHRQEKCAGCGLYSIWVPRVAEFVAEDAPALPTQDTPHE